MTPDPVATPVRPPPGAYGRTEEGTPTHGPLITDRRPRCPTCGHVLAWIVTRPWRIKCRTCRRTVGADPANPWPFP